MSYQFSLPLSHSEQRHHHHQVQQQTNNCKVQSQPAQEKTQPIHPECLVIDTLTGDVQQPHQKSRQPGNLRHPIPAPTSCANCGTLNTPLWRRNHLGATLCNACALFQKMKGRPRPMSLKTNVIKPRNRIKAIDRIPHARSTPLSQQQQHQAQKNKDGRLSTSESSNSSSSCSTPTYPHQHQQPNLIQQATSRLGSNHSYHHSSPSSPSDPQFLKSPHTYLLHPDYNNRKQGISTHSPRDSFRPPLSNSSAINLQPTPSFSHSQPSSQPSPLTRTEAYHSRKSFPGGPDPLNQVSSLSELSDQSKRRKPSLYAPHRATPTENSFPIRRSTPELLNHNDPPRHSSAVSVSRLHPSDSRYSPSTRRQPQLSHHHQHSPPGDHSYHSTYHPSTSYRKQACPDSSSSADCIPSRHPEREKGHPSVVTDPGRSSHSPITLPPLSQLTRHLKDPTKLQGGLRTAELGPPKSFEASAREVRLHTPTSPQNLLAIPMGRRSGFGRPLSVHSSVSDSDSVLSPIGLSSPVAYTSSPPDHRQPVRQRQTEPPITPPVHEGYSGPIDFHRRHSGPTRGQLTVQPVHSLSPKWSTGTGNAEQVPVEEVCQLKKRIAELELMVKRFGEVDGQPKTPLPSEHPDRRHPHQFEDDGRHHDDQLDQLSDHPYEEEEVDMIDDSF
ncbi:hypothetical protein MJO28_003770 [Puccinia striiformis f. sp. tritici]|uniref:Uncharacterized protein n=1 Tax=Puccinia striiformis f. sp. tritici TaxID=168172 RepID=A0ACC0EN90_9BASI|nr:hypothetical protein MJO28_003770 [Puccinia striiformis f. sp. tritici]